MQSVKHVVISCAGIGSRLGMNMPKCLLPIHAKKRLIDYILDLVDDIPNVHIVVGFQAQAVMDYVFFRRPDAIFVYNHIYAQSSNAYSMFLATQHLKEPFLSIDGDLLIEPASFQEFMHNIKADESLLGITEAKTDDAVFVALKDNLVTHFSRDRLSTWEWSGLAYFSGVQIPKEGRYIFEVVEKYLPIKAYPVRCYEIDTQNDLNIALAEYPF